jgi:hypothetical protein
MGKRSSLEVCYFLVVEIVGIIVKIADIRGKKTRIFIDTNIRFLTETKIL